MMAERQRPLEAAVVLLALGIVLARNHFVFAQGVTRTFSTRPFRGGPPQRTKAVLGGTAELPCDIRPPAPNDSYILVVWYKQDIDPIYSYDIRGKHSMKASEWMADYLKHRIIFRNGTHPATLNIDGIQQSDEGEYRCRVDFFQNPTRNSRVHLTVIIPPNPPVIVNEFGNPVDMTVGPYTEGEDMTLTCVVTGGRPEPTVRWWRGQMLIDATDEKGVFSTERRNTLVVKNLDRSDLHAKFTCQASNSNISVPVSASVAVEMHLSPLNVSIMTNDDSSLSAGRQYNLSCMTVGSRPPAKITWFMGGKALDLLNATERISSDGNMTTSILTFTPTAEDNGTSITCRAENTHIKKAEEDSKILNILYAPKLNLKLGANLNPGDIEEGDDIYFDCEVDANPSPYKVVWKHNGNQVLHNKNMGIIVQHSSLALRKVNRSHAGNYTCIASNVEGDGISNSVELKIMYTPICLPDQKRIYGVARHEEARILCKVESYPPPLKFSWAFNTTTETRDVSEKLYKNENSNRTDQAQSELVYKPISELDYGTVLCWASNYAGNQKNACIFHVIAAGKPEPPYNCTLTNQTTQSLSVECTAGFDGGQTQHFQLEVYDQQSGQLRANVSARDSATFSVHNLEPGRILRMAVYAVNSRGRSESTLLEGFTLKVAEKQTVRVLFTGTPVPFEITPILGILIGIVAALLLCTVSILLALKVRSDRRAQRPGDLPLKKATAPSSEDLYDADDRNPDVVPTNKDSDYQLTGSTAGTPLAVQGTPDGLSTTSLPPGQQPNHLPTYSSHNDYNNYPTLPLSGEVTYAELCLPRPSTLTTAAGADAKLASIGGLSSLAGFGSGGGGSVGGGVIVGGKPNYAKEATVYACIDHSARAPKLERSLSPPLAQQLQSAGLGPGTPTPPAVNILQDALQQHKQLQHHPPPQPQQQPPPAPAQHYPREVVTVRTPLISSQESCV